MCHQITYKLPCEHIRADVVYCADAHMLDSGSTPSPRSSGHDSNGNGQSSSSKRESSSRKKHRVGESSSISNKGQDRESRMSSSNAPPKRKPCRNLTRQSIAYPMPPSFEGDPSLAALSPLLPKCPLPRCPFEALNRCWNCCWCGKGWNEQGRCSCIMLIEGNQVRCEHICCQTCTTAGAM